LALFIIFFLSFPAQFLLGYFKHRGSHAGYQVLEQVDEQDEEDEIDASHERSPYWGQLNDRVRRLHFWMYTVKILAATMALVILLRAGGMVMSANTTLDYISIFSLVYAWVRIRISLVRR
jgi:hypothetical protein